MPTEHEVASASRALSAGLALIATFLGLSQWYEHRSRSPSLEPGDLEHFASQDRRRWTGVAALSAIALASLIASIIPSRVQEHGNPWFVLIWLLVLALILVLLLLAATDWLATRRYARRHRKQLLRESINAIRQDRLRPGQQTAGTPPDAESSDSQDRLSHDG